MVSLLSSRSLPSINIWCHPLAARGSFAVQTRSRKLKRRDMTLVRAILISKHHHKCTITFALNKYNAGNHRKYHHFYDICL
ncbi:hypothetical protein E2C01_095987 [Portunus trituberculatus]|uniref:Uncharacterized protein n=1 Tax=Portunus trituberculatus TaxID=210409 RepID=A0A5B7JWT5_PORTR|nr:hypothetical protein [Portunus trituberculatus]